jgi:hypothetical protein
VAFEGNYQNRSNRRQRKRESINLTSIETPKLLLE